MEIPTARTVPPWGDSRARVVAAITVGAYPLGGVVNHVTSRVYVTNEGVTTVSAMRTRRR